MSEQESPKPEPPKPDAPEVKPTDARQEILERLLKIEAAFPCKSLVAWTELLKLPFAKKGAAYEAAVKPTSFLKRVELDADFSNDGFPQVLTVVLAQPAPVSAADLDGALKTKGETGGTIGVWMLDGKRVRAVFSSEKRDQLASFSIDSMLPRR